VVFRYAMSRCGRAAAEEIVAETFAEAVHARGSFDAERGTPRAWLLGIATNRIRGLRRNETRHLTLLGHRAGLDDGRLTDLPDRVDAVALAPALARALAALPASERAAFLLHAVAELAPAEVAVALGISPEAARVRLHRARTRLRTDLAAHVHEGAA
jgi:RNA polymerase sigma factor (sigma-70 family)